MGRDPGLPARRAGLLSPPPRRRVRSYGALAWCYDELAALYSLGAIGRARLAWVGALSPGDRVLFAGVGRGADAVAAARRGARVVALDVSGAMLARCRARARRAGVPLDIRREDLRDHLPLRPYDAVFVPFVLNVFEEDEAHRVLAHLYALVRPGGHLVVSDFARPAGGAAARALGRLSYAALDGVAWLLGLAPLHPIYDTGSWLAALGAETIERRDFPVGPRGPRLFESLRARRAGTGGAAPVGSDSSSPPRRPIS